MKLLCGLILSGLLLSSPVWAKHWHEQDEHWNWHSQHGEDDDRDYDHHRGNCYFEPHDVRVISRYYSPRYRPLPPGLAKKYNRTGHLPPGWETRMEPMPEAVERQLAPMPEGDSRGIIDGIAVLYNRQTGVIIDVTALFRP